MTITTDEDYANRPPHKCPAPRCRKQVPFDQLACAYHWRRLPHTLKVAIYRSIRRGFWSEAHLAAVAEAIEWYRTSEG